VGVYARREIVLEMKKKRPLWKKEEEYVW